ncbi:MAG: glycosyltransferase family 39 protein [Ferruginibacter sp.]
MVKTFLEKHFNLLLLTVISLNATCFFPGITEGDAMLYANISKRIAFTGDWTNFYVDGLDWLDKPHLPFWITALSFKIFGVSAFAYKLPAFLFWLVSLYYTYRLAAVIYGMAAARYAVLIYGSALHVILANSDVRAEPYLTAFIVMATYFITQAYLKKNLHWFLFAAVASAGAIMTKGLFAGITIVAGFLIYLVFSRQLKELLNYRWWLCLFLSFLFIIPELYTLYVQFDMHPEKTVFGKTNVSGIKFFLWDSQFGRFFNTGPIKGKEIFYFLFIHVMGIPALVIFFSSSNMAGNKKARGQ